ncbi:phosphatidate cytidylyltransferase ['Fragaria x ananassa' phyllody phytoplasma]|uniref:Phosphatidate cytidylyltransferase n=1 Tax='Fragaria x ananassa' phyllody phytoplasma TaxID=2358428 RepID=A0ABS5K3J3_9MOLU|nr:phosphatidate cytidylyltransferase ['Fragaria x ananassa' phyllody phytoplasma]MBS2126484.1 phosphatidate cytidylyltransferase ['Fragaria x ananassa' phyllody phytoplasma]
MIKKRIITACVLVLCSFFFYYLPLYMKIITFLPLTIKGTQEMLILFHHSHSKTNKNQLWDRFGVVFLFTSLFFISVLIIFNSFHLLPQSFIPEIKPKFSFFLLFYPFILFLLAFVFLPSYNTSDISKTFLIMIYVGGSMASLLTLFLSPLPYLLFFVLNVVLTDSFAFLARFHKLFPFLNLGFLVPQLSPKKTKKGAILGTLGSPLATFLFFLIVSNSNSDFQIQHFLLFFIFAFLIAIISQISDLLASKFKREYNIKDFGNLLPGHGGLLDRFDSWIFTSFFALFLFISSSPIFKVSFPTS